ncbi:MAG: glycoside hydrolase family 15 protein [Steroidobacteraceae bacterium]
MTRQYRHSADAMLRSVSPLTIVKHRPGFAQTVVPHKGSIVASPVPGSYDPAPDYFFHWYRDSALVVEALRVLHEDAGAAQDTAMHFADFARFSLSLQDLDGRRLSESTAWRGAVAPEFRGYLRSNEDLAGVHGPAVCGETRVNPDGTLDISNWPRPQHDGPALRALSLLRWLPHVAPDAALNVAVGALLRADLRYTRAHWRESCFDIWEEEKGLHYYTLRVAAAALDGGAGWFAQLGDSDAAAACRDDAIEILRLLDGYWREDLRFFRSRVLDGNARSAKELDISVILAALHGGGSGETHSVHDPRMHATLARLEALFDEEYAINSNRAALRAPAMGRYAHDVYFSGGAYYFSTLAAAEFCFRAALRGGRAGLPAARALLEHGDAFMETVRAFTPPSGDLSEQFDQRTGEQNSAPQLAWSYAAFITCTAARRRIMRDGAEGPVRGS